MGRIPDQTIQAIRDRIDIVDLVGRYVSLKKAGRNFKGLCPFHDEKTPSFNVHPERQIFHCFGCGVGGNALTFLMRHENLTFPEATRMLAAEVGIEIPEEAGSAPGANEALFDANVRAQELYRELLEQPEGSVARAYLDERGIDPQTAQRFGIGFAPDRWDAVVRRLAAAKIPAEVGLRSGLLAERERGGHYDRLRARITFPIRDARGRILGFGGRAIQPGQEPKYLNTPESPIYRKREALFGLDSALESMRRTGRAVVAEGYFDVLALHRAGVGEAVATCGTALTPEHARSLKRRAAEIVLFFDGDEAGQRAVESALSLLLSEGLRVRSVALPPSDDPDTFLAREGAEALCAAASQARPALEIVIRRACAGGVSTPWEKADAVKAVVPLLAQVVDVVERGEFSRRLALAADVRERDVEAAVRAARRNESVDDALPDEAPRRTAPEERWMEQIAMVLLSHPCLAEEARSQHILELLPGGPMQTLIEAILSTVESTGSIDPAALAERLEDRVQPRLTALATSHEQEIEEVVAKRILGDTIRALRQRANRRKRRDSTRRFAQDSPSDPRAFVEQKQRELEERREILVTSRSTRH